MADPLPPNAKTPVTGVDIASVLSRSTPPTSSPPATESRGRGRPKGSRNLTPVERAQKEQATRTAKALEDKPEDALAKAQERIAAVKSDTVVLQAMITEQLNDHIMTMLIEFGGIKPSALYADGKVPPTEAHIEKYTPLGNKFAIPPSMAKSMARLAAEAKNTDAGKKATVVTGNGKGGLVIAGVTTLISALQYSKGLSETFKWLKEQREMEQRQQLSQQVPVDLTPNQQMNEGVVG